MYRFVWQHRKGDTVTNDFVKISILDTGVIGAIWLKNATGKTFEQVPDDFSIEPYRNALQKKLERICSGSQCTLEQFEIMSSLLTYYNGKLYVEFSLSVRYEDSEKAVRSEAFELLVPVG